MGFVIFLCAVVAMSAIYLGFIRNGQVFNFRKGILDRMMSDLLSGVDTVEIDNQLKAFDTASYSAQVFQFWKPLDRHTWYHGTALDQ